MAVLPIHPTTGLQALGWGRRGPIWPVRGASDPAPPADPPADPAPDSGGAGSKEAVLADLAKARAALKEAKAGAARADELEKKLSGYEESRKSESEKLIEAARREGAESVKAELTAARVLDKIEVRAAGKFADPEDAQLRLRDRAAEFVNKQGEIDTEAIDAALKELLEAKPHLAAGPAPKFPGGVDQGPREPAGPLDNTIKGRLMAGIRESMK